MLEHVKERKSMGPLTVVVLGYTAIFLAGLYALVRRNRAIAAMPDYDPPEDFSPSLKNVPLPDGQGLEDLPQ